MNQRSDRYASLAQALDDLTSDAAYPAGRTRY
jgi:hypothetical protein